MAILKKDNELKKNIIQRLENGITQGTLALIESYEEEIIDDFEIYTIKANYYLLSGNLYKAEKILLKAYEINMFNFDILYALGFLYEQKKDYLESILFYSRANIVSDIILYDYNECCYEYDIAADQINSLKEIIREKIPYLENELKDSISYITDKKQITEYKKKLDKYAKNEKIAYGYGYMYPWTHIGPFYMGTFLNYDNRYYIANYTRTGAMISDSYLNKKVEIRKVQLYSDDASEENFSNYKRIKIDKNKKILLPILINKDSGILSLEKNNKNYLFYQQVQSFYYYNVDDDIIINNNNYVVGEPIELKQDTDKKKLVVSIFIDGLCFNTIKQIGFENCMKNTAKYFSDGIILNNFHSTAEWTYPSMATYFTGLYTHNHKMYTNPITKNLPENTATLIEIFKNAGYNTAKIDGDWRTTGDLGYIRGLDRLVTAVYGEKMGVKEVVTDAIDHIELMKDTNSYLFLGIADLHDIADNYKLEPSVQRNIDFKYMVEKEINQTSVMLGVDENKKMRYLEQLKYLDIYLGILFNHIESTFDKEEVIVTLFSDHGQGYLTDETDKFFLNDNRTNVPLLIKGITKEKMIVDEYVSAVDYISIMNNIAKLNADMSDKDSNLPEFLGGKKRKYTKSHSLHANRPYRVAFKNEDSYFYFETDDMARTDGRVKMDNYKAYIYDKYFNIVDDDTKMNEYLEEVFREMKNFIIY